MAHLLAMPNLLGKPLPINLLLKTKLTVPPRHAGIVERPRLLNLLTKAVNSKLTLVLAPAGFGKTNLLTEWCAAKTETISWLTLDSADNDPTRFLAYFSAALKSVCPNLEETLQALLYSLQPTPLEPLLTLLINEVSQLEQRLILILDDFQFIENEDIYKILAFLLEYLPHSLRLIIATRVEPKFSLATLRARGQLVEIRTSQLRFTDDEVSQLLNQRWKLELAPGDIEKLAHRTEGWITGLQLAALSLQQQEKENISAYIEEFSGSQQHIFDYLADEVLQRQPAALQQFLMQTSILTRLSAGLCQALTGMAQDQARETLELLDKTNLFVIALDDRRGWYRYLSLFADFLQAQLHKNYPDMLPELHRRACRWLTENNLITEAIEHAIAATDYNQAIYLINQHAGHKLWQGEVFTVLNWLAKLPRNLLEHDLRLGLYQAWSYLLSMQLETLEQKVSWLEQNLIVMSAEATSFEAELRIIQASLAALQRKPVLTISLANQALTKLPASSAFLRGATYWTLAYAYHMSGRLTEAERAYQAAIRAAQVCDSLTIQLIALGGYGHVLGLQGRLPEAATIYRQAIALGTQTGKVVLPLTALSTMSLAEIYYEWNELETARHYLEQAISLSQVALSEILLESYLVLAQLEQAAHNPLKAWEILAKIELLATQHNVSRFISYTATWRARIGLWQANLPEALGWKNEYPFNLSHLPAFLEQQEYVTLGHILLAEGANQLALQVAENIWQAASTANWHTSKINALVIQAQACYLQGNTAIALEKIEQAVRLGEAGNYRRIFLNEGQNVGKLLRLLGQKISFPYLTTLLSDFAVEKKAVNGLESKNLAANSTLSLAGSGQALSRREVEVLQLLAEGYTNKEIATRLIVAASTVKTHIDKIFYKLAVSNRVQAIAEAKKLNLL